MATETNSGLFSDPIMTGMLGAGVLSHMYYLKGPVPYGSNFRTSQKILDIQSKSMLDSGLWNFDVGRLSQTPGSFKARLLDSGMTTDKLNKLSKAQTKYFYGRKSEAIRRLAAKKITTKGKIGAMGYFHKNIWKATVGKPIERTLLKKAAVGHIAQRASKVLTAGWQAGLLYDVGAATVKMLRQTGRDAKSMDWGKGFEMTEGMYTERQRAVQAITSSRMSTRAAIGGEAQLLHR